MLALNRKLKQQIVIGHQMVVTILAVPIRRSELTQYPPPIGGKIRSSPATCFSR
ncbi:MAG: hypothetical protein ACYC0X_08000 [Pirellulaceae bacterium]